MCNVCGEKIRWWEKSISLKRIGLDVSIHRRCELITRIAAAVALRIATLTTPAMSSQTFPNLPVQ